MNRWTRFLALSTFALGTLGQGAAIAALAPQSSSAEMRDRDTLEIAQLSRGECAEVISRRATLYGDSRGRNPKRETLKRRDVVVIISSAAADYVEVENLSDNDIYGFVSADALMGNSVDCDEFDSRNTIEGDRCAIVQARTRVFKSTAARDPERFQFNRGTFVQILNDRNSRWPYVANWENPDNDGYVSRDVLSEFTACPD